MTKCPEDVSLHPFCMYAACIYVIWIWQYRIFMAFYQAVKEIAGRCKWPDVVEEDPNNLLQVFYSCPAVLPCYLSARISRVQTVDLFVDFILQREKKHQSLLFKGNCTPNQTFCAVSLLAFNIVLTILSKWFEKLKNSITNLSKMNRILLLIKLLGLLKF